jgi:uncharacterized membrane protein YeiH
LTWEVLNIIGIIAFALSGAIIAMEEDYDILGILILGLVTAFGGGVIRNLLIEVPVSSLWDQSLLLKTALIAMGILILLPDGIIEHWKRLMHFFDAIGLSAFAIQGALYATEMNYPISAVIVAAVLTGTGGGIVRDLLAGRKPTVLRDEIYAVWAILAGIFIGLRFTQKPIELYGLFSLIVILRMSSIYFKWRLPHRIRLKRNKRTLSAKK